MKINGLNFNVKVEGDGVPFIWGHGLTMNMAVEEALDIFRWQDVQTAARVIRYDARGHGQSEATCVPEDYVWSNLARDMLQIANVLGAVSFIAGGQSMGCATAINAALLKPEQVKALVLANPPTAWETRPPQCEQYRRSAEIAATLGPGKLASAMKRVPTGLFPAYVVASIEDRLGAVYENLSSFDRQVLVNVYQGAALSDLPPREDITHLQLPILILAWEHDKVHPVASAYDLHALLPQSELCIAGDMSEVSLWPARIKGFLRKNSFK